MLDISYKIIRDEKDERKEYVPNESIKQMEGPIVCLTAPNGMGKSTMLNLISYAFYGDRDDKQAHHISPSLQSKIKELGERKDQELEFSISLTSPDGRVQLVSQKEREEGGITVREIIDGVSKPLPPTSFGDKYFLIYDIPENPIEKLKDISKEVQNKQNSYIQRLGTFFTYLTGLQMEISNARDEEKIKRLQAEVAGKEKICGEGEEKYQESINKHAVINEYYLIREYGECRDELERLEEQRNQMSVDRLKKTIKKRKDTVKTANVRKSISDSIFEIQTNITSIKRTLTSFDRASIQKLENGLRIVQSLDTNQIIDEGEFDSQRIEYLLDDLESIIDEATNSAELKDAADSNAFYTEIIKLLELYKSRNVSLPGTTASLQELIDLLLEESEKNKTNVELSESLVTCKKCIPVIKGDLNKIRVNLQTLKLSQQESDEDVPEIELPESQNTDEVARIKKDIELWTQKRKSIESNFEKYSLVASEYKTPESREAALTRLENEYSDYMSIFRLDSAHLSAKLSELSKEVTTAKTNLDEMKRQRDRKSHELEIAEKAEPHEYQKYKDSIDKIVNNVGRLDGRLKAFNTAIKNIGEGRPLASDDELKYNDVLSLYLAQRIPQFPYNGEYYSTKRIDLHAKEIETTTGKVIKTSDVSTGQGMSMYIRSLLASDEDNNVDKKYIVIFDEAHTMDRKSFHPIKQELQRMAEMNRLMFALFVKPNSDKFEYKNLE